MMNTSTEPLNPGSFYVTSTTDVLTASARDKDIEARGQAVVDLVEQWREDAKTFNEGEQWALRECALQLEQALNGTR